MNNRIEFSSTETNGKNYQQKRLIKLVYMFEMSTSGDTCTATAKRYGSSSMEPLLLELMRFSMECIKESFRQGNMRKFQSQY